MNKIKTLMLALVIISMAACQPKDKKAASYELPAVEDVVMYQVNPRVFAPENSLKVVASRIDSIADLGVNVMWVMPIYPIGKEKSKNSPYSISDYTAVAPEFGTIEDFKALVDSCHAHGMSIILDWVANHTAWDSKWMNEGHKDWYTQDSTGTVIFPEGTDWTDVADLNYDNPEMRAAMRQAMLFWIKDIGIDGFRCDVADQVPADFWRGAIDSLRKAAAPRRILMLAEGANVDNFTVGGFDMNYAWGFMHDMRQVWGGESAKLAFTSDSAEYAQLPAGKVKMRFTTNHDESTKATPFGMFGGDRGAMAAWVGTVFLHGGPLVYGSQEVGYEKPINFFQYVPVDWMAKPEIRAEYKKLIALMKENPALHKGELTAFPDDDVMVFVKSGAGKKDKFLILVNVRDAAKSVSLPKEWTGCELTDVMTGEKMTLSDKTELKPYEYRILLRR